jgi:protein-S-isoprenylcysteine O-methyltransferase Ste14
MPKSAYVQSVIFLAIAAFALFASAGTFAIAGFWIYLAIRAAISAASLAILDPDLIRERMRPGGARAPLGLQLVGLLPLLDLVIAGLDRGRLHWSDSVPPWLQGLGLIAFATGCALFLWAMAVNPFFSSIARIQAERGHRVITAGPYRAVRHPGYAAAVLLILGSAFGLGSWIAAAFLILIGTPLLFRRLINEDRLLRAELPGYTGYARIVRWRLIPGLW